MNTQIIITLDKIFGETKQYEHLIIRPYPSEYISEYKLRNGQEVLIRPIKPEDELLLVGLFKSFSKETMRSRFFQYPREISHPILARYCNIDYNKEVIIVAELVDNHERLIVGMTSVIIEPDGESGELDIVVGDPWQNMGLGTILFHYIIKISRDRGLRRIFAEILTENTRMLNMCRKNGFTVKSIDKNTRKASLTI